MPLFTIETTYRMPYYRQRTYRAATIEQACRRAIEDDDWDCELPDYECPGPTYVTGIWKGRDTAHRDEEIYVPSHFGETAHRMISHFHELLGQLAHIARPMGLPAAEFDLWLPKAMAAVEKARAIIEERRDPDQPAADKLFMEAGFDLHHTGGGCTAWRRAAVAGHHILITDSTGTDHRLGDGYATDAARPDRWLIGLHLDDGDHLESLEAATVAEAVASADRLDVAARQSSRDGDQ
jgi:hypothetical protein